MSKVITKQFFLDNLKNFNTKIVEPEIDNKIKNIQGLTVDTELSDSSEQAIANKAVKSALDTKVDLSSEQTISGNKHFSKIYGTGSGDNENLYIYADGEEGASISLLGKSGKVSIGNHCLLPTDTTIDDVSVATVNSTVAAATKATQDSDGNQINTTYVKSVNSSTPDSNGNVSITSVSSADKAGLVKDSSNTNNAIEIDYTGTGLTSSTALHMCAFGPSEHTGSSQTIRDISAAETKKFIGLGSVDNTADSDKSVKYATSSGSTTNDSNGVQISTNYVRSMGLSQTTMSALKTLTNTSPSFTGSASISDGPGGDMWYNVVWIPHRTGNGSGDNSNYGQLLMYPMTTTSSSFYRYEKNSSTWYGPYTYQAMQISVSGSTATITY